MKIGQRYLLALYSIYHKNAKQNNKPKSITFLSNIPHLDD